ncbi:hypothetical protein BWI93_09425 [Siphonobacter sp. BAB-5385]|uniref:hypothetical protein n=1 Tax=Siphonobacter sp. BAB-5385 TaxID=1864822 RepID=UPI000B9DEE31|nr:hypothetical protein [Siphonobacter sp. BAB-5385]OZI08405.1 hypothetical protein BWI93_09425 [Siphonobacter sp. BAB-5385]
MKIYLYFFTIVLLSASCTHSTLQLKSLNPDTHPENGLEVARQMNDSLKVVTAFESVYLSRQPGANIEYLIFDTEITNLTERPIEINPHDFESTALDEMQTLLLYKTSARTFNAWRKRGLDPDLELQRVARQIKQERKILQFNKVFNTVLLVGLVAADVATQTNSRQTYHEYASKRAGIAAGWQTLAIKRVADHQRFGNRMDQLTWEQGNFERETFRHMVLQPGEAMRGKLLLESNRAAHFYEITYPARNPALSFRFEQKRVKDKRR